MLKMVYNDSNLSAIIALKRLKKLYFLAVLPFYIIPTFCLLYLICIKQPVPFIDEVFHIPQGIKYIRGNFSEWDSKITTLPGLYIVTSLIFYFIASLTGFSVDALCLPVYMRLLNVIFSIISLYGVYSILAIDDYNSRKILSAKKALWTSLNIAIFPVSYFFNFFYYTDTLSTMLVVMMYKVHLENDFNKAAALGLWAVFVRQTNIIWIGYVILDIFFRTSIKMSERRKVSANDLLNTIWVIRKLKEENILKQHIIQFFKITRPYMLVCLFFVLFVIFNKGIVVGDKNAHTPVIHICQIFYLAFFILTFGFFHYVSYLKDFVPYVFHSKKMTFLCIVMCILVVHYNTLTHPYLLADNRHYVFYVWNRIYQRNDIFKYFLIPVYIFGLFCVTKNLNIDKRSQYWLCTCLCLIPQRLLEFRYFIIPYVILRLEMKCVSFWHLMLESLWFIVINAFTIYIFVTKEFYWSDSQEVQRIVW